MPAARKRPRKPAASHHRAAKPHEPTAEAHKPEPSEKPDAPAKAERHAPRQSSTKAYVDVDLLSWRARPLPRGTEVSDILPKDVVDACLADGRLTREAPEQD